MQSGRFAVTTGRITAAYERALGRLERDRVLRRIMNREAGVYTSNRALREKIAGRLGWVDVAGKMRGKALEIDAFGRAALRDGFRHVLVLGMGGSSLCPDMLGRMYGGRGGIDSYAVLDSTDPSAVRAAQKRVDPAKTLFIVSSKSGTTVETRSQMRYFLELLGQLGMENPGRNFVAITDRGSALQKIARAEKFRKVFVNPSDIGGRYSALSYFGIVPGWFAGADPQSLLAEGYAMERLLHERETETNPAAALAAHMAGGASVGKDKLTFFASRRLAPLVPWVEQLVAESTGKKGKGIVPVDAEPVGDISEYGPDRVYISLRLASEKPPIPGDLAKALRRKGAPLAEIRLQSLDQLGGQIVLWEAATAAAGWLMNVNPFDEPNVTESKENTNRILEVYRESGQFADTTPTASYNHLSLLTYGGRRRYKLSEIADIEKLLERFLTGLRSPQYLSFLSYLKEDPAIERALQRMRSAVRKKYRVATLRGYGPRFLHSIGQLYKGGAEEGRFIIFVRSDYEALEIPGRFYDFGQLITAQAIGDARALLSRDLPILVFSVNGNASKGIKEFGDVIDAVCQRP